MAHRCFFYEEIIVDQRQLVFSSGIWLGIFGLLKRPPYHLSRTGERLYYRARVHKRINAGSKIGPFFVAASKAIPFTPQGIMSLTRLSPALQLANRARIQIRLTERRNEIKLVNKWADDNNNDVRQPRSDGFNEAREVGKVLN